MGKVEKSKMNADLVSEPRGMTMPSPKGLPIKGYCREKGVYTEVGWLGHVRR